MVVTGTNEDHGNRQLPLNPAKLSSALVSEADVALERGFR
jgi:hypothetical protein